MQTPIFVLLWKRYCDWHDNGQKQIYNDKIDFTKLEIVSVPDLNLGKDLEFIRFSDSVLNSRFCSGLASILARYTNIQPVWIYGKNNTLLNKTW